MKCAIEIKMLTIVGHYQIKRSNLTEFQESLKLRKGQAVVYFLKISFACSDF